MVSKEKLKQKVEKTANALKGAGKKVVSNKKSSSGKGRNKAVQPHRHCRMCHVPIDLKRDPPICGEQKCDDDWVKNRKNEKMVRIAFFVFAAVFMLPIIGSGLIKIL